MPYVVADYIIERLAQNGAEALFGVPAVFCAPVFNAAARRPNFRTIVTNSDLEAGYAADGYARVKGLSAVAVSYGPGTLSIANAVAGAYIERSPIVVINGGPSDKNITDQNTTGVVYSHSMGRPHTDLDVFRNITVFSERESDINRLPQVVDDAIAAALIRKHPVYLEIPRAQLDSACPQPVGAIDVTVPAGDADAVATSILQELDTVANPVVIVGEEVQRYRLASQVLAVLDRLQVRWATTLVGKSVLPEDHPRFLGVFNGDRAPAALKTLIQQAGLIVALGSVFGSNHANLMIPKANQTIRVWDGMAVFHGGPPKSVGLPALVAALDSQSIGASPVAYTGGSARARDTRAGISAGVRRGRRAGVPRSVVRRHPRHLPRHLSGSADETARPGLLHRQRDMGVDRAFGRCGGGRERVGWQAAVGADRRRRLPDGWPGRLDNGALPT